MNFVFRKYSNWIKLHHSVQTDMFFGKKATQSFLYSQLKVNEEKQRTQYEWLFIDIKSKDPLEKAYARALGNVENGDISLPEFYKLKHKLSDLQKIKFAEDYDGYKVVSDLGGTRERELHLLQDQIERNERGELAHKLWKDRKDKDPQAKGMIGYM